MAAFGGVVEIVSGTGWEAAEAAGAADASGVDGCVTVSEGGCADAGWAASTRMSKRNVNAA